MMMPMLSNKQGGKKREGRKRKNKVECHGDTFTILMSKLHETKRRSDRTVRFWKAWRERARSLLLDGGSALNGILR